MLYKKSITPIVAMIILLLMTVTAAGATYYWMTNVQTRIQEDVQSSVLEGFTSELTTFTIVSSTCDASNDDITVVLLNTGTRDIDSGSMIVSLTSNAGVTLDSVIKGDFSGLASGVASEFTVSSAYNIVSGTSYGIKVTVPGGTSMTDSCTGS